MFVKQERYGCHNQMKEIKKMNEPLKLKLHSVYGQLLNKKILKVSWEHVRKNGGCQGVDKVSIKDFGKEEERYLEEILTELKEKTYKASPVQRKYIPKKNGKYRPLGIPTIKDRIIQQAVVSILSPFCEQNVFHNDSCGFRPGRNAELALKKIMWRIETGHGYVYDFDIKGYFDNIPHKKVMKVINKYISDGTVLQMIWKWLKAGYMEDGIRYETVKGTQQGGIISPLIANLYLNELDWELEKQGIAFVRYADDSVVFCKSKEELERAENIVKRVLEELGLKLAEDKTDKIDFEKDDFDFLGFTFHHWRKRQKDGSSYYVAGPSDKAVKKFKTDIKAKTKKTCTFSHEKWKEVLNPIIRGKGNYMMSIVKANKAVDDELQKRGYRSRCILTHTSRFKEIDGYIRQRLRVALIHKHPNRNKAKMLTIKFSNAFFLIQMGLVSLHYMYSKYWHEDININEYSDNMYEKRKRANKRYIDKLIKKGHQYYTDVKKRNIAIAKGYV